MQNVKWRIKRKLHLKIILLWTLVHYTGEGWRRVCFSVTTLRDIWRLKIEKREIATRGVETATQQVCQCNDAVPAKLWARLLQWCLDYQIHLILLNSSEKSELCNRRSLKLANPSLGVFDSLCASSETWKWSFLCLNSRSLIKADRKLLHIEQLVYQSPYIIQVSFPNQSASSDSL